MTRGGRGAKGQSGAGGDHAGGKGKGAAGIDGKGQKASEEVRKVKEKGWGTPVQQPSSMTGPRSTRTSMSPARGRGNPYQSHQAAAAPLSIHVGNVESRHGMKSTHGPGGKGRGRGRAIVTKSQGPQNTENEQRAAAISKNTDDLATADYDQREEAEFNKDSGESPESMHQCSGRHKERLFVGEAGFKGVLAFVEKHKHTHPRLGSAVVATELRTFGTEWTDGRARCEDCRVASQCDRCERLTRLAAYGVHIILDYDARKMDEHPETSGRRFPRIHWNCPHDGSDYNRQTLPPILAAGASVTGSVPTFYPFMPGDDPLRSIGVPPGRPGRGS
eukprot:TRINITY_DN7126_c0_g1_i3.p1 TRINITY_DN7126_c0_g1~~TRINITY_DN7126_c0_g1_i3.p1  ORF type:complete len:332 (+),score=55.54 TRINITY_DN7126_c0_g1_i3:47-1042(+)